MSPLFREPCLTVSYGADTVRLHILLADGQVLTKAMTTAQAAWLGCTLTNALARVLDEQGRAQG